MLGAFNSFTIAWVLGRSLSLRKEWVAETELRSPIVLVATTEGNGTTRPAKRYKHLAGRV